MRIVYVGNFRPANSTENHYAQAFENIGVDVERVQESPHVWDTLPEAATIEANECSFMLWTHTHDLTPPSAHDNVWHALRRIKAAGVPTVSVHLDRWVGLKREPQIFEPFFGTDYVLTADGGATSVMEAIGINHHWLPPAVIASQAKRGTPRPEFRSPLAFVGSWQGGYHQEWDHREKLVRHLDRKWGDKIQFWPKRGQDAVRGQDLADLYASVDAVVGDSCLVPPTRLYYSDRMPETIGRGGLLIHPYVEGCTNGETFTLGGDGLSGTCYEAGEDFLPYTPYDFASLDAAIELALSSAGPREFITTNGMRKTMEFHTYEFRASQIVDFITGVLL